MFKIKFRMGYFECRWKIFYNIQKYVNDQGTNEYAGQVSKTPDFCIVDETCLLKNTENTGKFVYITLHICNVQVFFITFHHVIHIIGFSSSLSPPQQHFNCRHVTIFLYKMNVKHSS